MTVYEPGSVDDVARYQAKKLAKEGDAAFARACGEFARIVSFRSLNETIVANVGCDRDKGAMFARVPTGFETCTFCLMFASRGAVYHMRKTTGEGALSPRMRLQGCAQLRGRRNNQEPSRHT